jgi:imidazolonepropionase-like amidohydrolase
LSRPPLSNVRRHLHRLVLAAAFVISGSMLWSAEPQKQSPEVDEFVRVRAPIVVLTHVRVIDGTGKPAIDDQNVVIERGRISRVEAASDVPEREGTTILDLHGYTVIPGIVGMHNHLYYIARPNAGPGKSRAFEAPLLAPQMMFSSPRLYLAAGVTSMRTTGSVEPYADLNLRDQIDAGMLPGPHIDVTAPYLEGVSPEFIQMHQLAGPDDAQRFVDYWASVGATSYKAYMHITRAELRAAIEAAHKHGLKVTGHLCSVTYPEAAEMGIDDLEHGFWVNTQLTVGKRPDECPEEGADDTIKNMDPEGPDAARLIQLLVSHHVAVTSTLPVFEGAVAGRPPLQARMLDAMTPEARQAYLYARNRRFEKPLADGPAMLAHAMQMERKFVAAGGLLLAGPDPTGNGGVLPGFGDQREIELLVEAGFSPVEAIRIATLNGAIYEGKQDSIGSIEAGKNADLAVIKGDPSKQIADIENTEIVFKDGVGYDSAKLLRSVAGRYGQY